MIEDLPVPGEPSPAAAGGGLRTAGAMLRAAREREGLHVAVLAATIKVSPAKLEALEQDRYADLPNATFARALAQSVCRSLKVDPRPVLALLPQADAPPLEGAMGRLNTPFQERAGRGSSVASLAWASKPLYWAGGLLMLAAVGMALVPADWIDGLREQAGEVFSGAPAASAPAAAAASAPGVVTETLAVGPSSTPAIPAATTPPVASATPAAAAAPAAASSVVQPTAVPVAAVASAAAPAPAAPLPAAPPAVAAPPQGVLRLSATSSSWVEVVDGRGQTVFSRVLQPGEAVGVDGAPPLRLHVGNAPGTSVVFRGEARDLAPYTRGNVARLELR